MFRHKSPPFFAEDQIEPVKSAEQGMASSRLSEASKKPYILLAEDNSITQHLISILLEQMGYDLMIVDNGQAAIDFLDQEDVDLVLMDCQMPVVDGFKATSHLRAKGLGTPIIALTAYARAEDKEQCLAAGMNDFLSKPFRQSELRDMLQKWLARQSFERTSNKKNSAV